MKQSFFLLLAVLLVTGLSFESIAQKLLIRMNNGDENSEQLNAIQKLYFSGNDLIVDFKSGTEDQYALPDVRKLYFDPMVVIHENAGKDGELLVFPNPAGNMITVKGIPVKEGMFRMFLMDGRVILYGNITGDHMNIDISALPDGLYLLNIEGYTTKFVKK
jgi:hypothetical protein